MPITEIFILPADVVLLPVADLPDSVREKVTYNEGDFAITRPHVRTPSKIIDAQAAELLKEFQTASTIVQAILNYSESKGADPHKALEEALPLLQNFIESRLLVPPDSPDAKKIEPTLSAGDVFDKFEIRQPVQILEDTELYQARLLDDGEVEVALKVVRNTNLPGLQEAFDREATVLRHLNGKVNPALIKAGLHDGRSFLAIEWFNGISLPLFADEIQQLAAAASEFDDAREALQRLHGLIVTLLDNYARLHEQGVIHSDVHPNNLLVNEAGEIKILDFGLARFVDSQHPLSLAQRGGVGFFFEPECAKAVLINRPVPQSTLAGEQYAVAAVAYQLLTGANHINFSLRNEEMLRQISEDETLPFSAHGVLSWPAMEELLGRALSKNPDDRFHSMREFADRVRSLKVPEPPPEDTPWSEAVNAVSVWTRNERSSMRRKPIHEAYIQRVIGRLQPDGKLFQSEIGEGHILPSCSADYGSAGIAYGLLRVACNRDDAELLALADLWISKTLSQANKESAFYNEKLELTKDTVSEVSFHHMINGVYFVRALISHALGDVLTEQAAIEAFIMASQAKPDNLDLTLGRSSVLHGCSLLLESTQKSRYLELSPLREFGDQLMKEIWEQIEKFAPVKESSEMSYLGLAHGWAGVLYATLRWCKIKAQSENGNGYEIPRQLKQRLKELAEWAMPAGRGLLWSWQNEVGGDFASGNNGFMPGWCNGNAGHVFLWTQAHDFFQKAEYLELARRAAWGVWEQPSPFNNLCCGSGGCAYALLNLYRVSGNKDWLARARQFGHRVATGEEPPTEHESDVNSLFKGEIGSMVLLDDLAFPETARMPLFE